MSKLPDFLLKISENMNSQNNRMTADPLFEVRYKQYIVTESGYNEHHAEVFDDDGNTIWTSKGSDNTDLGVYLADNETDWLNLYFTDFDINIEDMSLDEIASAFIDTDFDVEGDHENMFTFIGKFGSTGSENHALARASWPLDSAVARVRTS